MPPTLTFTEPSGMITSSLESPFGVFLDADDEDWDNDDFLRRCCLDLMEHGCRWFTCFGSHAEAVHDDIDDLIVRHGYDGVVTTYHSDETEKDAAEFFVNVALSEMKEGLVLVRNKARWASNFGA